MVVDINTTLVVLCYHALRKGRVMQRTISAGSEANYLRIPEDRQKESLDGSIKQEYEQSDISDFAYALLEKDDEIVNLLRSGDAIAFHKACKEALMDYAKVCAEYKR